MGGGVCPTAYLRVVAIAPDEYYTLELPSWASELTDAQRAVIMPPKSYGRDLVVRLNTGACTRDSTYVGYGYRCARSFVTEIYRHCRCCAHHAWIIVLVCILIAPKQIAAAMAMQGQKSHQRPSE